MKILINTPRLIPHGGVANHYIGLKHYWSENVLYNPIGKKGNKSGFGIFMLPKNIISFIKKIRKFNPDIIILNPSLFKSAIIRDMIFLRIAKLMNKKVVVFFHGFNKDTQKKINLKKLSNLLNQCECIFVLANEFANIIKSWGVNVPIYLTTTKVDNELLSDFNISSRNGNVKNILFLARITKEKGIFIALDTFKLLLNKYPDLLFRVVGNGPALEDAKKYCIEKDIRNVTFTGALSGKNLIQEYRNADLYLFPTYHAEGMPTSVLEAMAFGLPIISRPIGGLCDFFKNEEMGYLIENLEPSDFALAIEKLILNKEKTKCISLSNHKFAINNFLASTVAKNIENVLKKYI